MKTFLGTDDWGLCCDLENLDVRQALSVLLLRYSPTYIGSQVPRYGYRLMYSVLVG